VDAPIGGPIREPRQRWRVTFRRTSEAPSLAHRDLAIDWQERLIRSGLPLAGGGRGRQPLTFGAALPMGMAAERELADIVLVERLPAWRVREALEADPPPGIAIDALVDVWLGEPPIAAAVAAADYRVRLEPGPTGADVSAAAASMLASRSIPWQRERGGRTVDLDLRPLVAAIDVLREVPLELRIRALIHPERGTGRPDELVAALGQRLGRDLPVASVVRERVLLADELRDGPSPV
jgi:radical SAM-linked protein